MTKRMNWALRLTLATIVAVALAACTEQAQPKQPNQFTFTNTVNAEPSTVVESNTVTISGSTLPLDAKITGPSAVLLINGNPAPTNPKVKPGDDIAVRMTSSATFGAKVTATVTVGTVKADYSVTTRAASTTPTPFEFTAVTGAARSTDVQSNTITLAGFDGELEANITGGTLHINDTAVTTPTNVTAGDKIYVIVTSSPDYAATTTATVTIGTESGTFNVTTLAAPLPPTITSFTDNVAQNAGPGESVTLSWTITGVADNLELDLGDGTPVDVTGLTSYDVTAPEHQPDITYTLTASNTELSASDIETHTLTIPLWVCNNNNYPITFPDTALETALRQRTTLPTTGPISCTQMQGLTTFSAGGYSGAPGSIESLVGLQHAVNLTRLVLQWNEIDDVTPLAGLDNLEVLNFDKNHVLDLSPISGLTNLIELGVWANVPVGGDPDTDGITNLSPLAGLTNLQVLYISENNVSDLTPLTNLTNLRVLFALGNDISDISPLAGMTQLQALRLGYQTNDRSITSISALSGMTNLSWLELQFTGVTDLTLLGTLQHLYAVNLRGMRLKNAAIADLLANTAFPDPTVDPDELGDGAPTTPFLGLAVNCIDTTDPTTTTNVTRLQTDGVTVTGYTPADQVHCVAGTSFSQRRQESLDALDKSGKIH